MRLPELDDDCAWCVFEGRLVRTFAYRVPKQGVVHWCPWHQKNVPSNRSAQGKDRIPPSAQEFPAIARAS